MIRPDILEYQKMGKISPEIEQMLKSGESAEKLNQISEVNPELLKTYGNNPEQLIKQSEEKTIEMIRPTKGFPEEIPIDAEKFKNLSYMFKKRKQ